MKCLTVPHSFVSCISEDGMSAVNDPRVAWAHLRDTDRLRDVHTRFLLFRLYKSGYSRTRTVGVQRLHVVKEGNKVPQSTISQSHSGHGTMQERVTISYWFFLFYCMQTFDPLVFASLQLNKAHLLLGEVYIRTVDSSSYSGLSISF